MHFGQVTHNCTVCVWG